MDADWSCFELTRFVYWMMPVSLIMMIASGFSSDIRTGRPPSAPARLASNSCCLARSAWACTWAWHCQWSHKAELQWLLPQGPAVVVGVIRAVQQSC